MRRLLERLAELALRAPRTVVVVVLAPCALLGAIGAFVPVDLSFTGIMDKRDPLVARYYEVSEQLRFSGRLPLLLEGPEARLDEAADALVPALEALDVVEQVVGGPPDEWLRDNAAYLVEPDVFADWLALATRPEDSAAAERLATSLSELRAEVDRARPEGARLVMVRLGVDPLDLQVGGGPFGEVQARTDEVLAGFDGVRGRYTGLAAIAAQDQARTLRTVRVLSPVSLLLVLLVFRLVERRLVRLLAVAVPMLLTVGATLGTVGTLTGRLTVMETFFGVMVFGLGVDFALHLMVRLREERSHGRSFEEGLKETWRGTGTGVVAGGITTAGAFFIVGAAPDPLALHLGLSGGVGLIICLVLMLTVLPATWVLLERRRPDDAAPPRLQVTWLTRLSSDAVRRPAVHIALAGVLLIAALAGVSRFRYETDLQRVFNRQVPALDAMKRVQELFGVNPGPWLVVADDLDEARRVAEGFEQEPRFSRVDSAAELIRADRADRAAELRAHAAELEAQKKTYQGLLPLMADDEAARAREVITALTALARAAERGPPELTTLPDSLASELVSPRGEPIVYAYPTEPTIDGLKARAERLAAQRVHPDAAGFGQLLESVMASERPWALPVFLAILAFVVVLLAVDMRSARRVAVTLAPVVFGTLTTFGLLCWAGMRFNVLTTFIVPLLIGLGVDDGIHIMHRLREPGDEGLAERCASVGGAILMTTLTTCVSFATLLFTDHAGLEGIAWVVVLGLPLCLLASVSLMPALCVAVGLAGTDEPERG